MDEIVEYIEKLKSKKIYVKFSVHYATTLIVNNNTIHIIKIYDRYILSNADAKYFKILKEDSLYEHVANLMLDTIC